MTLTIAATVLWAYMLGGTWEIGPFTDRASCENARAYQLAWGIKDVSPCVRVEPRTFEPLKPGMGLGVLTPEEFARRVAGR